MNRVKASLLLLALAAVPAVAAVAHGQTASPETPTGQRGAAVQVSHSGWRWGNPLPQGDPLNVVEFAGARGYAAGEFGTLLRSDDAGRSWRGISTGLTESLTRIRLLSADSLVVAGGCALRRSDDGGATFRRLPWTASDARCTAGINSVAFPTPTTGFLLLGNGNVLRSIDSGRTWARRTAVPGTPATSGASRVGPTDLFFTSPSTGFAATSGGSVFMTIDAGSTWTPVVDEPFAIRSVVFPTAQVGYAVGDAPFVLKTSDGGTHWTEQPLPEDTPSLSSVRCANETSCLAVTGRGDRLVRTVDGGASYETLTASTERLRAVAFASPTRAVAVGDGGTTVTSDDGGRTFSALGGVLTGAFTGVKATSGAVAYAFGRGGALARTTNGGRTWQENDAATSDDIRDVSYVSRRTGFVLDVAGQLLRTDNAGASYQILNAGTALRPEAVEAISSRRVLLVGPVGIRRSVDGGQTFKADASRRIRRASFFDVDRVGETVLAYGPNVLRLSHDGGATWRAVRRPATRTRINQVDLVTASTAYLLDASGRLYRTDDAGRRWRYLQGVGSELAQSVRFSDARHGWVTMGEFGERRAGYALRTEDGGRTWAPQLVARAPIATNGLAAPAARTGFVLTNADQLFATAQGGSAGGASRLRISSPTRRIGRRGDAVRIDGRLDGARGGERIVVSFRERGSSRWLFEEVVAASNGTFTVVARVGRTAQFVAQWEGDASRRGAGTPALVVGGRPPS